MTPLLRDKTALISAVLLSDRPCIYYDIFPWGPTWQQVLIKINPGWVVCCCWPQPLRRRSLFHSWCKITNSQWKCVLLSFFNSSVIKQIDSPQFPELWLQHRNETGKKMQIKKKIHSSWREVNKKSWWENKFIKSAISNTCSHNLNTFMSLSHR